jgi:hypothetical protein
MDPVYQSSPLGGVGDKKPYTRPTLAHAFHMNADDISQRLAAALLGVKPKDVSDQARDLLVKAFDLPDWDSFVSLISRADPNNAAKGPPLSRTDFHSRMIHMMKAPRKERENSFEHFKQMAREADYDFCALARNKDGWSIACRHYRSMTREEEQDSHNIAVMKFMLEQGSNPLQSEGETELFWNQGSAPHDFLMDWVIGQEKIAPKRTRKGGNPIHYFAEHTWMERYWSHQYLEMLKDKRIPNTWVNDVDNSGLTPLHYVWLNRLNEQLTKTNKPLKQSQIDNMLVNLWLKTFALIKIGADMDAIYPPTQKPLSFHIAERIALGDTLPQSNDEIAHHHQIKALENKLRGQYLDAATQQTAGAGSARRL